MASSKISVYLFITIGSVFGGDSEHFDILG